MKAFQGVRFFFLRREQSTAGCHRFECKPLLLQNHTVEKHVKPHGANDRQRETDEGEHDDACKIWRQRV